MQPQNPQRLRPASLPVRDIVLPNIHSTGHSSHSDHVQDILHMLAQIGAPDSDSGASVYRSSQWLHLFQDKNLHLYLPVNLWALRQPQSPILSSMHTRYPRTSSL